MKPSAFDYQRPETLEEALAYLASHDDARALAGGQSLVPMLNMRLSRPELLVDLNRIQALATTTLEADGLRVGAMVRQRTLERDASIQSRFPFCRDVVRLIGHATNRNRGTVGGSLCHSDPAAELPALAMLAGAVITASSASSTRHVNAAEFFAGYYMNALEDDELLTEVFIPALPGGAAVREFNRRAGDFATAGAMASLACSDGVITAARLVVFAIEPVARRLDDVEAWLIGQPWSADICAEAAAAAGRAVQPSTDAVASAAYRRHLVTVLCRRTLQAAYEQEVATGA